MLSLLHSFAINISQNCQPSASNTVCVRNLPNPGSVQDGSFVRVLLQIIIGVVAAICVLFVAIGGLRYILSQGDPQAAAKARSTIINALLGLAVTVVAQGVVVLIIKVVT